MDWEQAISILTHKSEGDKHEAIDALYTEVKPLCETATDGPNDTTHLWDWLDSGDYSEGDTPESIAEQWDDLGQLEY